ncbi:MAG: PQQ-binding-like beta-propeller repeat protein [Planctomycetota bacterium]|nr:PQQ-binding-like beta-propeller repeat protein [Planctomycetota bacterium]
MWSNQYSDSYSGPIVGGGKVFTTETVAKRDETLIALDQQTGEQVWKQEWAGAMAVPFFAKANGDWIRSTPATDGKTVVVGGMRDVVAAFDAETGNETWRIDFVKQHGATIPSFGLVCSPLIDGEYVYMQAGGAVRKINLADGELVWEAMGDSGGMYGGAFSSPIISELHGVRQLVVQTRKTLCGISLESGDVLWQQDIPSFRGMNILTPSVWKNSVFTSSYGGKAFMLSVGKSGGIWSVETAWKSKTEAYMSSPVIVGDHLYVHLRSNRVSCVDLATGEETWRTTPFGKYWSMVTNGKNILSLDEAGDLRLIAANPEKYTLLDEKRVSDEPSWAHLAVAGSQVFIRRQRGLDAYTWS